MRRALLLGLVLAAFLSSATAVLIPAIGPGGSIGSGAVADAAPASGPGSRLIDPPYAFFVGDWQFNPATGHWYAQLENTHWEEAEAHAVRLGGHLVSINDQAEQGWLFSTFGQASQIIGFNDLRTEGTWAWSNGEPVTYTNWGPGFPEIPAASVEDIARFPVAGEQSAWFTAPADARGYAAIVEVPSEPTTGWISGTVSADGAPVRGIVVEALIWDPQADAGAIAGSATSDASGAYEIGGLAPGPYVIAFRGNADLASQFWPGAREIGAANPVHVRAGGIEPDIEGTLEPTGAISGRVTDGVDPIANIVVMAGASTGSGTSTVGTTRTRADGTYTLVGLPSGDYRITFEDPEGVRPAALYVDTSANDGWSVQVDPAGTVDGIDAVLKPLAPSASPPVTVAVDAWRTNPATGHAYAQVSSLTWAQAEAYAVRFGGHLVTINDEAEEQWLVSTFGIAEQFIGFNDLASPGTWSWSSSEPVTYTNFPPQQPQVDVGEPLENAANLTPDPNGDVYWGDASMDGEYPALLEVPQEPTSGWIAGTVTVGGAPRSGVEVQALAPDGGIGWVVAGAATTNATGRYEIGGLAPGDYRIAFRGGADLVDWYWGTAGAPDSATTVSITAAGVVAGIDGELVMSGYRESGVLVPALTTRIPTPADISTDPPVVGTNLFLAALVMILFTVAGELLNRTLAENEDLVGRLLRPSRMLGRLRERVDAGLRRRIGPGRALDVVRLAGIAAIYGLIFSLLDRTWDPLSVTGMWLFFSMAIAFGVVGIADDLACWIRARRWGAATELELRSGNLVLALASTAASRLAVIIPGIMIGTPEALGIADDRLDDRRRGQLAATGLGTLVVVGGVAWLLTLGTTAAVAASPSGDVVVLVRGLEAFLLIVFAVAVQNAFAHFLAFRGTAGRVLRDRSRVAWLIGLLAVTFLFWHTLVNPRGDLAVALEQTNVLAFIATAGGFTLVSLGLWAVMRVSRRPTKRAGTPVASA